MDLATRGVRDGPGHAARTVARNTLFLAIADVVGKFTTFGFMLVAARRLGTSQFGTFSFGLAFVSMFVVLTDLGLGQLAVREIARDAGIARRYAGSALAIKLVATVIVIAIIVFLVNVLGYSRPAVRTVCICSLAIADSAFTLFYRFVFQAFERTVFAVIGRVIQTVILAAGLVALCLAFRRFVACDGRVQLGCDIVVSRAARFELRLEALGQTAFRRGTCRSCRAAGRRLLLERLDAARQSQR
jgi:hypothetical protein